MMKLNFFKRCRSHTNKIHVTPEQKLEKINEYCIPAETLSILPERDMTPDEIETTKREEEFIELQEKIRDLDKFVDSVNDSWKKEVETRIQTLENLLNIKNKVPKRKKQGIKTIEAVIKVMEESKNELHMNDIFNMIKKLNLKNQNVSINTVKTTIYNLLKEKRIKRGKKPTYFQICQSSKKT